MNDTAKEPMIYRQIAGVMKEIGAVKKDSKNQQQGFLYRGIDAVMNALNPALIHNRIFVAPQVLEQTREERTTGRGASLIYSVCRVKYTFYAEDGSSVEAIVVGEGMDSGDKATNKAMSAAFKYACFQVFCIPTEEMYDPDADSPAPHASGKAAGKAAGTAAGKSSADKKQAADGTASAARCDKESRSGRTAGSEPGAGEERIDAIKIATLHGELQRTGVSESSMCDYYQVQSVDEFTTEYFISAMNRLKQLPDRIREKA